MNDTTLQILVQLKDEASAAFKNMGQKFKESSSIMSKDVTGLSKTLLGASVAVGGLAVAFGTQAIKAYGDSQLSLARIDSTLQSMGESALKNKDAILEHSQAALRLGFDDDAAAESITRFYQATGDLTKAFDLNNLAMDLSRAKNIDLATAANLVNQVLSGNSKVLKQYQIDIKDSATPLQALGELQQKVSGQAEAAASTWPVLIESITLLWDNFNKSIGKVLVEALLPFVKEFQGWLMDPETQKNFKKWTDDFKSWADVTIPVLIGVFELWYGVLKKIYDMMIAIGTAITGAIDKYNQLNDALSNTKIGKTITGDGAIGNAIKSFIGNTLTFGITNPFRADGGSVNANTPYIVGERGPEAFIPGMSGTIVPNDSLNSGAGTVVNIYGGQYLSEDAAEEIGDLIISRLKMSNAI